MLRTIWKYPLQARNPIRLNLPVGATILHMGVQQGAPTLWALVEPEAPTTPRTFCIVATGEPFETNGVTYIATFMQGAFVWHLFEVVE